jgi:hypothetical protein
MHQEKQVPTKLLAGSATVDITPDHSLFLYGYPHVPRNSTGVHDPLLSCALFLSDSATSLLFIANDVLWVTKDLCQRARTRIESTTGVPAAHIMITATHTHSAPVTGKCLSHEADPVVPDADPAYLQQLENAIVLAAEQAFHAARPAEIGFALADGAAVGTNRRDPQGPAIPQVPVLAVRDRHTSDLISLMLVCTMHPTVLHEDSTLISGDFPGLARQYLQQNLLTPAANVVYHMGAAGNQSPRHVTRANTFAEAQRLGHALAQAVATALQSINYRHDLTLFAARECVDLPLREMPSLEQAQRAAAQAKSRFEQLRQQGAQRTTVRTAECDWFGSEEVLTLARAATTGRLRQAAASALPAEVLLFTIGDHAFVGWPGEVFVEFAIQLRDARPNTHVITLANGELQGYLVTADAVAEGGYEASNAVFQSPQSGDRLVKATLKLLGNQ